MPINKAKGGTIVVFESNLAGKHISKASRIAQRRHGAVSGVGFGFEGNSFAIPFRDMKLKILPLDEVDGYVKVFQFFARRNSHLQFNLTRLGCECAGYEDKDVAPMFKDMPKNVHIPAEWEEILTEDKKAI